MIPIEREVLDALEKQLFGKKSIETLLHEMAGENRLRRVLGPISLTSLGIGAIIGAGIFVMTGRAAAVDAGPAIVLSYVVAGLGCLFAALCYAEFALTVPVAGSAYTYAYATLGELFAWMIGWDLVLEYAMACSVVASDWSHYLNELILNSEHLLNLPVVGLPESLTTATLSGGYLNLPAVIIMVLVTVVLVIGIRESATTNAVLVMVKIGVVLFVIVAGWSFINPDNWTRIPPSERLTPAEGEIVSVTDNYVKKNEHLGGEQAEQRGDALKTMALAEYRVKFKGRTDEEFVTNLPKSAQDRAAVETILQDANEAGRKKETAKWGILAYVGINQWLAKFDDSVRSPFMPYGFSGIMLGAAIIFFAYIGFDSISTHSEEARNPQRDVPIGIIASLVICTVLYILVALVITGMEQYWRINPRAAVAAAFRHRADEAVKAGQPSTMLHLSGFIIAVGALAGMTSVLLITFLSQARIFLAMARDRLLPPSIFGAVHPRFRTPHRLTILTGVLICLVAALFPTEDLENMVNIGTLLAFAVVSAAVLVLRIKRPDAHRPFRTPLVYLVAPLGIGVNLFLTLFLPWETWLRLLGWLVIGLIFYFTYGVRHSVLGCHLRTQLGLEGIGPTDSPLNTVDKTKDERYQGGTP